MRRTGDQVANQIRMLRSVKSANTFLILEGSSDSAVMSAFIDEMRCTKIISLDRTVSEEAIRILNAAGVKGVLAIVDADFDRVEGRTPLSQDILRTDGHDLEMMLITSPALTKVVTEFGSPEKIEALVRERQLLSVLLEMAMPIGCLRLISLRSGLNYKFEGLKFSAFIGRRSFSVDPPALAKEIQNHSALWVRTTEELVDQIRGLCSQGHDPVEMCCGHDVSEILALGFRNALGTRSNLESSVERIESSLRLAYEADFFAKTLLYDAISNWQELNSPFIVLSANRFGRSETARTPAETPHRFKWSFSTLATRIKAVLKRIVRDDRRSVRG